MVDSTQGVEAQTLANVYLALDQGLEILPVLNKVDLPSSDVEGTREQIEAVIGLDCSEAISASGKTGVGVAEILEQIVAKVPPPKGDPDAPLRALIFDTWYDSYRGAVVMVRVVDGSIKKGDKVRFMATKSDYEVTELGSFQPFAVALDEIDAGEVGFIAGNIRSVHDTKVGDTVTHAAKPAKEALPGFKDVKPMVFAGIFPTDSADYPYTARRAREAPHERRGLLVRARLVARRSASGSAAGSSAFFTWRSSRSGSSASSTSTSSPRRRASSTTLQDRRDHAPGREPGEAARRRSGSTASRSPSSR